MGRPKKAPAADTPPASPQGQGVTGVLSGVVDVPNPPVFSSFDLLNDAVVADALTDDQREALGLAAVRELDSIAATQAETRDAAGTLREAHLVAQVLALRLYGYSPSDTAEVLGVPPSRVASLLQRVRRDADVEAQLKRLDAVAVPLAVDNIIRGIIAGDKDYTLEMAKGRGLFKTHAAIKQETEIREVKISIEAKMPEHYNGQPPSMKPGAVVSAAAPAPKPADDGEIVDAE